MIVTLSIQCLLNCYLLAWITWLLQCPRAGAPLSSWAKSVLNPICLQGRLCLLYSSFTGQQVCAHFIGSRDHLGYYNALGLEPGAATLPAIKKAFRQAALMWHPDRQKVCFTALKAEQTSKIEQSFLAIKVEHYTVRHMPAAI